MADIRLLQRTLQDNVSWNKARLNLLAQFLLALLKVRTVNLSQIASAMSGRACFDSHYKRLQRFLRHYELPFEELAQMLARLSGVAAPWVLVIDRTEWKIASRSVNVLVLGLVHEGVVIPLLWEVWERAGSSSFVRRRALLEEFGRIFGFAKLKYLCADREFHGKQWYAYLGERQVAYRLRIRHDTPITTRRGKRVQARQLVRGLKVGHRRDFRGVRVLWGQRVQLSALRLSATETLLVVGPGLAADLFADYKERWKIETLFGCLKSRGFELEETKVTEAQRLKKLLVILALAFCWALKVGEIEVADQGQQIKTHQRPARSIFRTGLDRLRRIVCNLSQRKQEIELRRVIQLLSCT